MFIRQKFITNSSSTCFIAYGVYAEKDDEEKFKIINEECIEQDGVVGIVWSPFDKEGVILYLLSTEKEISEYSMWQDIEHYELDEHAKGLALKEFDRVAEKYGCYPISGPHWGIFNSGH